MTQTENRNETINRLAKLIREFPVAMLTTIRPDGGLHCRPMANLNREFNGDLWFLTNPNDPKIAEINASTTVNVCFSDSVHDRYISMAGHAEVLRDGKRAELMWSDDAAKWFPPDTNPTELSLIRVDVTDAEFWDATASAMVALGSLVHQVVSGESSQPVQHEKVQWNDASGGSKLG